MLREFVAKQVPGDYGRRWFVDDYFDLFVWFDESNTLYGFQLCYDKEGHERALTWRRDKGYSHETVDTGEAVVTRGGWAHAKNMSPILVHSGFFQPTEINRIFTERSKDLPKDLREFILERLSEVSANQEQAVPENQITHPSPMPPA